MKNKVNLARVRISVIMFTFVIIILSQHASVQSADLGGRYVQISDSTPSAVADYEFGFTISTVDVIGSIEFLFCENSPIHGTPCTSPAGFNASAAVLDSQNGEIGFLIDPISNANRIVLSRAPSIASTIPVEYNFSNITNPNSNGTVYARIATFSSVDATVGVVDTGGTAFSTASNLSVVTFVPPYLTFCVGVTVALNCTSANGNSLNFGELSSVEPRAITSQFSGATNDPFGFVTSVSGVTMTSGSNIIPALSTPSQSTVGVSQFGMNLRANSNPAVGNNSSGVGTSIPTPDYNSPNFFTFKNGVITNSNLPTDFNLFTATYIVNVSPNQKPGVYNTTLTYVAVAAF